MAQLPISDNIRGSPPWLVKHEVSAFTGEPCCHRAIKHPNHDSKMRARINSLKTGQKKTGVVRTGCIPCLSDGVRCDGSNPKCQRNVSTEAWLSNYDFTLWRSQGTWRERHGFHVFVSYTLAPESLGWFESPFWHRTVVQACVQYESVYHIASAIGALQEHVFQRVYSGRGQDSDGLAFALRQCNKAIKKLTSAANAPSQPDYDPGIVLITCILFSLFQALHGDSQQAMNHALQGRKLLQNLANLTVQGRGSRILDPLSVTPVIGILESQAKALQGKYMEVVEPVNRPVLPDIERIYSLDHANYALQYVYVACMSFCQGVPYDLDPAEIVKRMRRKAHWYAPWLQKWEQNFAAFLFRESDSLSVADMQRAKVLKANHLTAMAIALLGQSPTSNIWDRYDTECKAIIDLSASVLKSHHLGTHATLNVYPYPFLNFGLWVSEPLFVVMARCKNQELRKQAAGLLQGQARAPGSQAFHMRKAIGIERDPLLDSSDTDEFTTDQWLEFLDNTRLDTAMATYFARLPSSYIDAPSFLVSTPQGFQPRGLGSERKMINV